MQCLCSCASIVIGEAAAETLTLRLHCPGSKDEVKWLTPPLARVTFSITITILPLLQGAVSGGILFLLVKLDTRGALRAGRRQVS
ncbi:hypothetical protein AHAS_Ahas17G0203100 [Arachis hypogaea]